MSDKIKTECNGNAYVSISEAKKIISQRRNNPAEMKSVMEIIENELWKNNQPPLPALNGEVPKAYLWRNIASARYEDIEFYEIARSAGCAPYWLEYTEDKYSSRNPTKTDLLKLRLFHGLGKKGGPKIEKITLSNPCEWENRLIKDIITIQGEPLTSFHHRIRKEIFPTETAISIIDISTWLQSQGKKSVENYPAFLSLFIAHGILFEDFEAPFSEQEEAAKQLEKFKKTVFMPAWQKVIEITGKQPIIVRLPSTQHLSHYPGKIRGKINFCPLGY